MHVYWRQGQESQAEAGSCLRLDESMLECVSYGLWEGLVEVETPTGRLACTVKYPPMAAA
jgi:hypothetical protein